MKPKEKDFFKSMLRYLLYKLGDGENAISRIMRRKKKVRPKVRKQVKRQDYNDNLKKNVFISSRQDTPATRYHRLPPSEYPFG